jgi:hypothetical protein
MTVFFLAGGGIKTRETPKPCRVVGVSCSGRVACRFLAFIAARRFHRVPGNASLGVWLGWHQHPAGGVPSQAVPEPLAERLPESAVASVADVAPFLSQIARQRGRINTAGEAVELSDQFLDRERLRTEGSMYLD